MARPLRIEYEGAIYHVLNRGDRREDIFLDDEDRTLFVGTLGEACAKADWQVHAFCLMDNHFHLVLETPQPTLVAGMKWMLGAYTQRFNARHRVRGHLFAGRYKALSIDNADAFYLRTVCDYVHLNPSRAGAVAGGEALAAYRWSSYPAYLAAPRRRPPWLRIDRVLGEHGIVRDNARARRQFADRMERQRRDPRDPAMESRIREGWGFGGDPFLLRLRERMAPADRELHEPVYVRESMGAKAARILEEELSRARIHPDALETLPKGAPIKIRIARRLRESTTLTLRETAALLQAGSWRTLANALSQPNMKK